MMLCRAISWFICIFVGVSIATTLSGPHSVTESLAMETVQEVKQTAAINLSDLLDAGDGAVVTLVARDTRLVAHRAVLAARSPVFAAQFRNVSPEASNGVIAVSDMEGPVLRQLLSYLYTLRAPQLPSMALQLLAAADMFGLTELKAACEQQVLAHLSVETVAAAAVVAIRHSCDSLRPATVAFIRRHLLHVMATDGWADAVVKHPRTVVDLTRMVLQSPAESSSPAPADSGTTLYPATQPCSDQGDHSIKGADGGQSYHGHHGNHCQYTATAAPLTTTQPTPPSDGTTVSCVCTPTTADNGTTPAAHPHNDHSAHGWTPTTAAPPSDPCSTPPLDVASICPLWSLSAAEKGKKLIQAANDGALQEVRMLLAAGADVGATDGNTNTALHWAAWEGRVETAMCLMRAGADVNACNWAQNTPLHWAAWGGRVAVVRMLVAASADPNARNVDQATPLHFVGIRGSTEVATVLLDAGSDRWARDKNGDTPKDIAKKNNYNQLVDILR